MGVMNKSYFPFLMNKCYWPYLKYVLRHKFYVAVECTKVGLFWRALTHDLSKFLPSEFIPYANHFLDEEGSPKSVCDKTGYYKPTDTGDPSYDFAWFLRLKRNSHHWQYWVMPEKEGVKLSVIPLDDCKEMVCDWIGAGKAQGTRGVNHWYARNKSKLQLHPASRTLVENFILLRYGDLGE